MRACVFACFLACLYFVCHFHIPTKDSMVIQKLSFRQKAAVDIVGREWVVPEHRAEVGFE